MQLLAAHAYQCVLVWVSEDVGAARVSAHDGALANERDADARGVQRLLLTEVLLGGGGHCRRIVRNIPTDWVTPDYFSLRWTKVWEPTGGKG